MKYAVYFKGKLIGEAIEKESAEHIYRAYAMAYKLGNITDPVHVLFDMPQASKEDE